MSSELLEPNLRPDSAFGMDVPHSQHKAPSMAPSSVAPSMDQAVSHSERTAEDYYGMLASGANKHSAVLGSRRPKPKKMWQQRHVKLLVVGDSGLGKTTLVRCLLAVPGEAMVLHDGSSTCFDEFQKCSEDFLSTVEWDDDEDHVHWVYQIQDTPGYGDDLNLANNIARVKHHIRSQNKQWLALENSAGRGELSTKLDPRVDVCIFCLPPHRVRNIDMLFMYEVSQLVPILPVVTKADTMTIKECIAYRTELYRKLQHPCLPGRRGCINLFSFSEDTLGACGLLENAIATAAVMRPPYLVVCSNEYSAEHLAKDEPELWPERRYMWGTSQAMNPKHSDLLLLRRLLLQEGLEEISRSKVARYEAWRKSELKQVRPLRKIARALLTSALTLTAVGGIAAAAAHASGRVDVRSAAHDVRAELARAEEGGKELVVAAQRKAAQVANEGGRAVTQAKARVAEALEPAEVEAEEVVVLPATPAPAPAPVLAKKKGIFGF